MNNFCSSCGSSLTGGNNCPNCGAPVQQIPDNNYNNMDMQQNNMSYQNMGMQGIDQTQTMMQNNPGMSVPNTDEVWKNKNATTAIILEIISFFIFGFLAPVGLCLAIQGFRESKEHNGKGKSLSIAGIVIGIIFTIFYIIALTQGN